MLQVFMLKFKVHNCLFIVIFAPLFPLNLLDQNCYSCRQNSLCNWWSLNFCRFCCGTEACHNIILLWHWSFLKWQTFWWLIINLPSHVVIERQHTSLANIKSFCFSTRIVFLLFLSRNKCWNSFCGPLLRFPSMAVSITLHFIL